MYRIIVSCTGISDAAAIAGVRDIAEEFQSRPWHRDVRCFRDGLRVMLQADNEYDTTGQALLDEFSDAVCACVPIEDTTISFRVESVTPSSPSLS